VDVELGQREPLDVEDVGTRTPEHAQDVEMLGALQWKPEARASEEARGQRVETLGASIPVGVRRLAEAEARRRELDVGACTRERRSKLVVVPRRESGRIRKQHAHRSSVDTCSSEPGTSFTATRFRRGDGPSSTR
jgi:hypothetical protein